MKKVLVLTVALLITVAGVSQSKSAEAKAPHLNISNVQATSTAETTALVKWNTNKLTDSRVVYWTGTTTGTSTQTAYSSTSTKKHSIALNNLKNDAVYEYFVVSSASDGKIATSSIYSFNTKKIDRCSEGLVGSPECSKVLAIFTHEGNTSRGGDTIPRPIDSTRAFLVYGLQNLTDINTPFGMIASSSIGLGYRLDPGTTPTFNLNASNTPEFNTFLSYLTDGQDQTLNAGCSMYTPDGTLITGEAGGNIESSEHSLNGNPDLQGYLIDFVRFIIHGNNTFDAGPGGVGQDCAFTVEIWKK